MHIACASCGADLDRPPSRIKANGHQFCDRRCLAVFQSRRVEVACAICGTAFELRPCRAIQNRSTVCSEPCRREAIRRAHIERLGSAATRVAACAHCRAPITRKPSQLAKYPATFCSRTCKRLSQLKPGSVPPYAPGWTSKLRRSIRERDGHSCRRCGWKAVAGRGLDVHHRDLSKTNHAPDNLVSLCRACHMTIHPSGGRRNYSRKAATSS